jgi:hypothetical protein
MDRKYLPWLASAFIFLWTGIYSWTHQSSVLLSLAGIIVGVLIISLVIYALYRITGNKVQFLTVCSAVSIGLGILIFDAPVRSFIVNQFSEYLLGPQFFLKMEWLLVFMQIVVGTVTLLTIVLLLPREQERKNNLMTRQRLFWLLLSVIVLFELVVAYRSIQPTNAKLQSSLSGFVQGEELFTNNDVSGRCNAGWCVDNLGCQLREGQYYCTFVVDILLNESVNQRYLKIRDDSLNSGTDNGILSIRSDEREISRIMINFTKNEDFPMVLRIAGEGYGPSKGQAEQDAAALLFTIVGAPRS